MLISWLHLLALTVYLGSVIGLWVVFLPSLRVVEPEEARLKLLARGLKLYDPLQIGALGLVVLSGAFGVTALKAAYRSLFAQELGGTLALKLLLAFVLIILSTYQAMGIGHHFVRRYETGESVPRSEIERVIRRLKISAIAILLLALPILWLGVRLQPR